MAIGLLGEDHLRLLTMGTFVALCLTVSAMARDGMCDLQRMTVQAQSTATASQNFVGQGAVYEFIFEGGVIIDGGKAIFPDPPLTIRHRKTGKICQITDGGIWISSEVYLTSREDILGLGWFSGSTSGFDLFKTNTCKKIASTPVASSYTLEANRIISHGGCEPLDATGSLAGCCPSVVQHLTDRCELIELKAQSRAQTKKELGLEINRCEDLEFPGTSQVRLLKKSGT
jgi:hypothetical protein